MWWIGAHISAAGGLSEAVLRAQAIGATAFALFLKNQRQWFAPPLTQTQIQRFQETCSKTGFLPEQILPHNSYLVNLCSPDPELRLKSQAALKDELERCYQLGLVALNIHPGSTLKRTSDESALNQIAQAINTVFEEIPKVKIFLENTAGQGSNLGYRFEHLAHIIDNIRDKSRIAVCLDTCHAFAAGYPLDSQDGCQTVFETFDRIIGARYLQAMHLNDSKGKRGSRLDRHASLGEGEMGYAVFHYLTQNNRFQNIPLILETPDPARWPKEIAFLIQETTHNHNPESAARG